MAFEVKGWMLDELQRRKQMVRDLWSGKRIARIPLDIRITIPSSFTTREQFQDGEKQLSAALASARATWTNLADHTDCIPAMRPDVGCSCLASAFGTEYYWGDSVNQTPGVRDYIITNLENQVDALKVPDVFSKGWLPEGFKRIKMFAEAGEGLIPVSLLDAAGGVNVAADLMGMTELLIATKTMPDALHRLLNIIQALYVDTIYAGIKAAGGEANITTTDFPDTWFPEGSKGHVSDDISAAFGPETYREFSAPYHAMIFKEFGRGGLHNCGPNPCHSEYMAHEISPRNLDLADSYSHKDLGALKHSLKGKGFIYLYWDGSSEPGQWYEDIMDLMAPDVIVVPVLSFHSDEEASAVFHRLRPISEEYAARMNWGWLK
jgi:hypothetical protein